MRVIRAEFMGLCFGVRDALSVAEQIAAPEQVSVFGELVHNPIVQRQLTDRGFHVVDEESRDQDALQSRVMITAHGISEKRRSQLSAKAKELIDTTCPLVRRVHEAAMQFRDEGRFVVLIGRRNHVEVQGITEDLERWVVIQEPDDALHWAETRLGVLCQSTTTPEHARACLDAILQRNPNSDVRYVDTICRPTRQRQMALEAMCSQADICVVVGGKRSNNTRQLTDRCRSLGCVAYQVEDVSELDREWFRGFACVGLTAGTSTPDITIEEVATWLSAL
jgi:4-hydroxy-3-methylbut-2-enyl diphosphate reductase